jgi:RNA polymerase sigma-70 factor (ECF subfamily)
VIRQKNSFEVETASFRTWLFTIAKNLKLDFWRKRRVRETATAFVTKFMGSRQALSEATLDVRYCLMSLPRRQREVLFLRYMEGFTGKETATILNIPEGTVASRLNAGVTALKRMLDPEGAKTLEASTSKSRLARREVSAND